MRARLLSFALDPSRGKIHNHSFAERHARLRIITGSLKGRAIPFNPRRQGTINITSSRLKEAFFAMLGTDLRGQTFLDLCGGCGQIGLEAYSRGARLTINESDARRLGHIRKLVRNWHLEGTELHQAKAQNLLPYLREQQRRFDTIYVDPPYGSTFRTRPLSLGLLDQLADGALLAAGGRIAVQHQKDLEFPSRSERLALMRERSCGDTTLSIYHLPSSA